MPRLRLLPEVTTVYSEADACRVRDHLLNRGGAIAVDSETTGLDPLRARILCWSMATEDQRYFIPEEYLSYFDPLFRRRDITWYLANAKFDMHMFANMGYHFAGDVWDIIVADAMDDDTRAHGLKDQARIAYDVKWGDFKDLFLDPAYVSQVLGLEKSSFTQFKEMSIGERLMFVFAENPMIVENYASCDAYFTYMRMTDLRTQLIASPLATNMVADPEFQTLFDYFRVIEVPFTKVLWDMEREGVPVDLDYVKSVDGPLRDGIRAQEKLVREKVGPNFNPYSNDELRELLFTQKGFGLTPISYTKNVAKPQASTSEKDLEMLQSRVKDRSHYQFIEALLQLRHLKKLHSTYVEKINKHLGPDGKVHCRYNQTGARCMPKGELVLTARGYLPVEAVVVGDQVLTHTGSAKAVTEISQHQPEPIYRVTLASGVSLRTTGNHEYYTGSSWCRADALTPGAVVATHSTLERWVPIEGWPNYSVSSWGRVRGQKGGLLHLSPKGKWGHLKVALSRNGAQSRGPDRSDFTVHNLVARAFLGPRPLMHEIRHLNGIAWDNTVENLKYGTSKENKADAIRHRTMFLRLRGTTKLTEADVANIRAAILRPNDSCARRAKITSEDRAEIIRSVVAKEYTQTELARRYNVTQTAIHLIVTKKQPRKEISIQGTTISELALSYRVARETIRDIRSGLRWKTLPPIIPPTFALVEVTRIDLEVAEATIGLTVADDHSHVTGGIVTHNTGRLSASDPNMQNIPIRDDAFKLRGMFTAPPGEVFMDFDYPQIQPRLAAIFAGEEGMMEAIRKGWDIHSANAANMYKFRDKNATYDNINGAKIIKDKRERHLTDTEKMLLKYRDGAKTVGLGVMFGQGPTKMGHMLDIDVDEAKNLIKTFFETYPDLKRLIDATHDYGHDTETTYTMLGRIRRLHRINNPYNKGIVAAEERMAFNCLDEETEALTQRGWVKGFDLQKSDLLLTKNLETGAAEWHPLLDLKLFENYTGDLVEFKNKSFSALSTPDHRWPVFNKSTGRNECRVTSKISDYGDHRIHRTAEYGGVEALYTDDFVELLGWVCTDGGYAKKHNGVRLYQSERANPRNVKRIDKLLVRLGLSHNRRVNTTTQGVTWELHAGVTAAIRAAAPARELHMALLAGLTKDQLQLLLETVIAADGWETSAQTMICARSKQHAEMLQVLCVLCGKSASVKERDLRKYGPRHSPKVQTAGVMPTKPGWLVSVHRRDKVQITKSQKITHHVENTRVWCPVVENTYFMARRSGTCYYSGNTLIQGSEVEVMKLAMLQIAHNADFKCLGARLAMTVHDELVTFAKPDVADDVFEIQKMLMANPLHWGPIHIDLPIPVDPDGGRGFRWTDAH